jgi:hypothetical protein
VQVFEELQEIGQGPPEPIDRPSGDHVELAPGDCLADPKKRSAFLPSMPLTICLPSGNNQ